MERKHVVMIILGLLLVTAVWDLVRNTEEVFENFFTQADLYRTVGGMGIDENLPSAKADQELDIDQGEITQLKVDNPYGNVYVEGIEEDSIRIQATLTVYAEKKELAEEMLKEIQIDQKVNGDVLWLGLNDQIVFPLGVHWVAVHYTIYLPEELHLDLESRGDLLVNSIDGQVIATNIGGVTRITDVQNNLSLNNRSGAVEIKEITGDLDLRLTFGSVQVKDIQGNIKLEGRSATIEMEQVQGSVDCTGSQGQLRLTQVDGNLTFDMRHTPLVVNGATGWVDVENTFGDVELINVAKDINVVNNHGNIRVRNDYNHRVNAEVEHGKIYARSDQLKIEESRKNGLGYKGEGILGNGEYRMELETRFGNIELD